MNNISENNKRIAKNTILLYIRMFFIMAVSLYTSRVILNALGIEDYGIFNVVGGIVSMMGMFNSAMSSSTTRYLTFELGKNDNTQLTKTFSISLSIYYIVAIIFLLLSETIGLWFLNTKLIIPDARLLAANWVFQFTIFSVISMLFINPYNACIIAHEEMGLFAYISIFEVLLKLFIVYLLGFTNHDHLIVYGFLYMLSSFSILFIYVIYCHRHYKECTFKYYHDLSLFSEIVKYSGWNLFGSVAGFVRGQGLNILINMFFNPAVNAARGIAYQVNTAVTQFINNFYTAAKPQITKYYAQNDIENMNKLVFRSSKLSFFLMLILSLPIVIEAPYIIKLWLGQLPEYVVPFVRIIIIISAIDGLASPLMTVAHATGRIALYQSLVGSLQILNIPISYFLLYSGNGPLVVFYVSAIIAIICLFTRLWICNYLCSFPFGRYSLDVILRSILVCIMALFLPIYLHLILPESFMSVICVTVASIVCSLLSFLIIGLNKQEREIVFKISKNKLYRS